ncbi:MAG: hypothetical protein KO463_05945 [Candidatus Methanofastidiosa archaeon]|nr:hypothetical protein [Candidatus Methanofastidiosa archaeon]
MRWYIGKEREPGETEQPYWGGFLRLRLPFIHYPWEWPEFIEGAILCVVPMGVIAGMQASFGITYEMGLTMVIINNFLYLLHTSFGDPGLAGWITSGIPLYMAFVADYATPGGLNIGSIQAMCALQLIMAAIFLIMAFTGGAKTVANLVPTAIKSGILLGAGLAAIIRTWENNGSGIQNQVAKWDIGGGVGPLSISFLIAVILSFFILWSPRSLGYRKEHKWFAWIAKYGIAPTFIVGYIIGVLIGEVPKPTGITDQGWIFSLRISETYNAMSPFVIGWPSAEMFIGAISTAIVAYILAFGDILVVQALIDESNNARKDELIYYDPNRANFWSGIRDLLEALIWPYLPLAGPQWTAGQALVVNRYKQSTSEEFYSYWGGATCMYWGMASIMLVYPIVLLVKPALPFGFGLTMAIQGYLCCYLAMEMVTTNLERGIAGMIGGILATRGATWALLMGVLFYLALVYGTSEERKTEKLRKMNVEQE